MPFLPRKDKETNAKDPETSTKFALKSAKLPIHFLTLGSLLLRDFSL